MQFGKHDDEALPKENSKKDTFATKLPKVKSTPELEKMAESLNNDNAIANFGLSAESTNGSLTHELIDSVKNNAAGESGKQLALLATKLKMSGDDNKPTGLIQRFFHKAKKSAYELRAEHQSMAASINAIADVLEKQKDDIAKNNRVLDALIAKSNRDYEQTGKYIDAGTLKMQHIADEEVPKLREAMNNATDENEKHRLTNEYQKLEQKYLRISKRVYALRTSQQAINLQIPQANIAKNTNSEIIDKINNAVHTTIPLWEDQYAMRITLKGQKDALDAMDALDDATNNLLVSTAEAMKDQSVRAVKQSNKPGVTEETLEKTSQAVIDTLDACREAYAEGEKQRQGAAQRIAEINRNYHKHVQEALNKDGGEWLQAGLGVASDDNYDDMHGYIEDEDK